MKQQKWKSKSFALLLAVMMMFTMMPQMAFADEQAPAPHDASLASRYRLRWQLRPLWTFTTDERHAHHTKKPPAPVIGPVAFFRFIPRTFFFHAGDSDVNIMQLS